MCLILSMVSATKYGTNKCLLKDTIMDEDLSQEIDERSSFAVKRAGGKSDWGGTYKELQCICVVGCNIFKPFEQLKYFKNVLLFSHLTDLCLSSFSAIEGEYVSCRTVVSWFSKEDRWSSETLENSRELGLRVSHSVEAP